VPITWAVCWTVPNCKILGGAEVRNLDGIVGGEHQVRGLDVAVDDVAFMRELQRATGLIHDAQRARKRKGVAVIEQRLQALPLDQFHCDVNRGRLLLPRRKPPRCWDASASQRRGLRFGTRQEFGA